MTRFWPPLVITGSRLLRAELQLVEQHCGLDFDYHDTLADARRYAVRREVIIIGADVLGLVRRPWRCRGPVLAVTLGEVTSRLLEFGARAGVGYTIQVPTGRSVLVDTVRQAHHALTAPPPSRQ
jgi:hypothetical protein